MKFPLCWLSVALLASRLLSADGGMATTEQAFSAEVTFKLGYRYLLTLPEGYAADAAKKWPLLVFLHGAGERGDNLELLKKHGPPKLIAAGKTFPAIVVCPQVPANERWNPHSVKALVDAVRREQRVDDARIYITGISMGGFGTWDTIAEYPQLFAAAVPICGGAGINIVKFALLRDLPIWIFHGAKDPVVPLLFSEMPYKWLKNQQASAVQLTVYPEAKHDSWTETYDNPALWEWLFAQSRH